jgi:hypothetical protein
VRPLRVSLPAVALVPVQPFEALQEVALVELQVSVVDPPLVTLVGLALRWTVGNFLGDAANVSN